MKQPLYALLISPDEMMRDDILTGKKTITIREGWRDYSVGTTVMLCCHLVPWTVMADITSVRHCALKEVTKEEFKSDGFNSRKAMLDGLKRFYKDITLNSPVTVIHWENARGVLVIEKMAMKCFNNDKEKVRKWFNQPQLYLGGKTPNQAIQQGQLKEVEYLIRKERGAFS